MSRFTGNYIQKTISADKQEHLSLMGICTLPYFSYTCLSYFQRDNFCDFLFVSLRDRTLPKRSLLLTHCILVGSSTVICWSSPFVILRVLVLFCHFYLIFDGKSCKQTM